MRFASIMVPPWYPWKALPDSQPPLRDDRLFALLKVS
jgi:hypothetical protein